MVFLPRYVGGGIDFKSSRSSSTFSWNRYFRVVHCWRLASSGPETGGPLQHPVAQTVETGIVSTGFDRPLRPPSTAKDQAVDRAAISSCRGKTRARVAREGRRDRQDRARVQRVIARVRSGVTTAIRASGTFSQMPQACFRTKCGNAIEIGKPKALRATCPL